MKTSCVNKNYLHYLSFYDKYNSIPNITSDELTKDIECIFPSTDALIDVCILKSIGDLFFRLINKQKWMVSPNIKNEIIELVKEILANEHFEYKMNYDELYKIISTFIDNYDETDSLLKKIREIINFYITQQCEFMYNSVLKLNFNRKLNYIFNKYCTKWKIISDNYSVPLQIIASRFDEITNSELYLEAVKFLETIDSSSQKVINDLINKSILEFNSFYVAVYKAIDTGVMNSDNIAKINRIETAVFNDFQIKVDDICNSLIQKLKLRNELNKIINDIFRINHSTHLLTLKLQLSMNVITNLVNIS
jgi:hypothetical protein